MYTALTFITQRLRGYMFMTKETATRILIESEEKLGFRLGTGIQASDSA